MEELRLPWKVDTPQKKGYKTEAKALKQRGAAAHPRSGAGKIKADGSTTDDLIEIKYATKTHTVKGEDILTLFNRAALQEKSAVYVIHFANGIVMECQISKENTNLQE